MRKYLFKDNFEIKVEGYLSPEQITKLEKEHGLLQSATVGNQTVVCGYGKNIQRN